MSDELFDRYENLNTDPEKEQEREPVIKAEQVEPEAEPENAAADDNTRAASYTDHGSAYSNDTQKVEDTAEQSPTYSSPYSDVKVSDTEDATPAEKAFTDPYSSSNYYTPQTSAAPSYSSTQTDNGFYHHSYVNSRPAQNYSQPVSNPYTQQPYRRPEQPKKEKAKLPLSAVAIIMVVCVIVSGFAGFGGSLLYRSLAASKNVSSGDTMVIHKVEAETTSVDTGTTLADKSTSEITNEVADSVVEITTEVMQTNSFYGQYIATGAGSGVIISDDGYIITNNHVIEDASSVKVTLHNGDSYDAEVIGADSVVDIALIKIDAKDLTPAVFGDSDTLSVGDKSVIIGNPLGTLGGSVSEGIISALDRTIVIDGQTMHLMQTDAAINPGNSGGGMFNGQGELTGIVVAKSSSEEIDNIGFVIPINNVLAILSDLKDYGYVRGRADSGMTFVDLSNSMYSMYYYGNANAGCYVYSVKNNSNASKAGFQPGDRVISVNGETVSQASDIENIINSLSAGDKVTFELERNGATGKIELTLEEAVPDTKSSDYNNNSSQNPFGGFGFGN